MKLSYTEIKKLKGVWLIDKQHRDELVQVISVTGKKIRLTNGATIITSIFTDKHQKNFELAPEEKVREAMEERQAQFFETHAGEIRGLYNDKYHRNGGWNGMMDAITDVEKRYKAEAAHIDVDYLQHDVTKGGQTKSAYEWLVQECL